MPAPRSNADEVLAIAAQCWGFLESERLGGWELRAGGGFTPRANSAWPLGPIDGELSPALDAIRAWYAERDLPGLVQVVVGSELDQLLNSLGCADGRDGAYRQVGSVSAAREVLAGRAYPNVALTTADRPQDRWLRLYRAGAVPPRAKEILGAGARYCYATVYDERSGEPVAIGRGVIAGESGSWVGLAGIDTALAARHRGLAHLVVKTLLDWAAGLGAQHALLEIAGSNSAALQLYERLGFTTAHQYHFREIPATGASVERLENGLVDGA